MESFAITPTENMLIIENIPLDSTPELMYNLMVSYGVATYSVVNICVNPKLENVWYKNVPYPKDSSSRALVTFRDEQDVRRAHFLMSLVSCEGKSVRALAVKVAAGNPPENMCDEDGEEGLRARKAPDTQDSGQQDETSEISRRKPENKTLNEPVSDVREEVSTAAVAPKVEETHVNQSKNIKAEGKRYVKVRPQKKPTTPGIAKKAGISKKSTKSNGTSRNYGEKVTVKPGSVGTVVGKAKNPDP